MGDPESGLLSIGDVCAETGLSPDVVRVWERRYGFPEPVRLPSGHRRYRLADLNRLRLLAEAAAKGHRPAAIARLDEEGLRALLLQGAPEPVAGVLEPLHGAVAALDSAAIRRQLQEALGRHGLDAFLRRVVAPLLDWVGLGWADGSLGEHHEHLVTEVLEDVLRDLRRDHLGGSRGTVVLSTLPGERHRLGLLMAALVYAARGWRTELLGVDLPVANIASAARTLKADAVAVSLSIQSSGEPSRRLLSDLRERLPAGCRLVIGGQGAARTRRVEGVDRMLALDEIPAF